MLAGLPLLLALLLACASGPCAAPVPAVDSKHAVDVTGNAKVSAASGGSASQSSAMRVTRLPIGPASGAHVEPVKTKEYHPALPRIVKAQSTPSKTIKYSTPAAQKATHPKSTRQVSSNHQKSSVSEPYNSRSVQSEGYRETPSRAARPIMDSSHEVHVNGNAKVSSNSVNTASQSVETKHTPLVGHRVTKGSGWSKSQSSSQQPRHRGVASQSSHLASKAVQAVQVNSVGKLDTTAKNLDSQSSFIKQTPISIAKNAIVPSSSATKQGSKGGYYLPPVVGAGTRDSGLKIAHFRAQPTTAAPRYHEPSPRPMKSSQTAFAVTEYPSSGSIRVVDQPTTVKPHYPLRRSEISTPLPQEARDVSGESLSEATSTKTKLVSVEAGDGTQISSRETKATRTSQVFQTGASPIDGTKIDRSGSISRGVTVISSHHDKPRRITPVGERVSRPTSEKFLVRGITETTSGGPPAHKEVMHRVDRHAATVTKKIAAIKTAQIAGELPPDLNKLNGDGKGYIQVAPTSQPNHSTRSARVVKSGAPTYHLSEESHVPTTRPTQNSKGSYHPKPDPESEESSISVRETNAKAGEAILGDDGLERRYQSAKSKLERTHKTLACSGSFCDK